MDKKQMLLRRISTAVTVLAGCAAAVFLLLWLNPDKYYVLEQKEVSADRATQICPSALITQEEFDLAARLLDDPAVTAQFPDPGVADPPVCELSPGLVDAGVLSIDGQDVRVTAVTVLGLMVYVDYAAVTQEGGGPGHRCILTISYDGSVTKSSAQYEKGELAYLIESQDNGSFTLTHQRRDLLYFLHD